jgi:hypothetical protein
MPIDDLYLVTTFPRLGALNLGELEANLHTALTGDRFNHTDVVDVVICNASGKRRFIRSLRIIPHEAHRHRWCERSGYHGCSFEVAKCEVAFTSLRNYIVTDLGPTVTLDDGLRSNM